MKFWVIFWAGHLYHSIGNTVLLQPLYLQVGILVSTVVCNHNIVKPSCRGTTTNQMPIFQEKVWVEKVHVTLLPLLKHCLKEVEQPDKVAG